MSKKMVMKVIAAAVAIPLALSLFVMAVAPAEAKGLTQLTDPNKIVYGTTTQKEKTVLKDFFNLDYYIAQNPDVVEKLGTTDYDALFDHFCNYGIYEGRVCSKDFDPSAYAAAYSDARDTCGTNILLYYLHYATVGKADNRTITTLEACAKNNITVTVLGDDSCKITPEIYELAEKMGITDYKAAIETKQIIDNEKEKGNDVVITVTNSNSSSSGNDSAASGTSNNASNGSSTSGNGAGSDATPSGSGASEDASGAGESGGASESGTEGGTSGDQDTASSIMDNYEPVATITTSSGLDIKIYRGTTGGYGAWNINSFSDKTTEPMLYASTDDYVYTDPVVINDESSSLSWDTSSMGTEVLNIPIHPKRIKDDGGVMFMPGAETANFDPVDPDSEPRTTGSEGTATCVEEYETEGEVFSSEWPATGLIDDEGTAATEYEVGITLEGNGDQVTANVGIEGDDGFTLEYGFTTDTSAQD
ncbi:hypothetical protein [Butyrivibrio sp. XPD2006]|uniref:hypothetical protein n=1 Tax=Butyrivibrio sp. XPD2006 TaxID=1280668 RepID=UPI0003B4199C|nr:hypothetical protein [Butyrivibrio sp. XPD2006]